MKKVYLETPEAVIKALKARWKTNENNIRQYRYRLCAVDNWRNDLVVYDRGVVK